MQHTDFFARIRAIKTEEYKELQAAVELHGGIYEWDLRNPEHPVIAVNLNADTHHGWVAREEEVVAERHPLLQWLPKRNGNGNGHGAAPGMLSVMNSSISIMQDRITRARMAGDPPEISLTPHLGELAILDFHRASEAIAEGEACVERMLPLIENEVQRFGLALSASDEQAVEI